MLTLMLSFLNAARVVPKSCDQIVIVHNKHCLGQSSVDSLGECMKTHLSNLDLKSCATEYNVYLGNIDLPEGVGEYTLENNGKQVSYLVGKPVDTPELVEIKMAELESKCPLQKRGFGSAIKQVGKNIYDILNFSVHFIHWIIYFALVIVYAVPVVAVSILVTIPYLVTQSYFQKFGCVVGFFANKFELVTRPIEPWRY
eukprot:NODE_373_length_9849_cov_0.356205.p5 type:complete len:199 gc:universal NODE_373_length_9849_cov_0.356205:5716-6312(+)